ncbi:unnamed protein product, partial [Prunus brigantina]
VRDDCSSRPRFGWLCSRPTTKDDGAGTKMTGPPSSSYPSRVPPPAAVVSPENRREGPVFVKTSQSLFSVVRSPIPATLMVRSTNRNLAGFAIAIPATSGGNFGKCSIYKGDSAEFSAESLVPLLLLRREVTFLRSELGMGGMPGSPQDSSRILGNSGRVLSL